MKLDSSSPTLRYVAMMKNRRRNPLLASTHSERQLCVRIFSEDEIVTKESWLPIRQDEPRWPVSYCLKSGCPRRRAALATTVQQKLFPSFFHRRLQVESGTAESVGPFCRQATRHFLPEIHNFTQENSCLSFRHFALYTVLFFCACASILHSFEPRLSDSRKQLTQQGDHSSDLVCRRNASRGRDWKEVRKTSLRTGEADVLSSTGRFCTYVLFPRCFSSSFVSLFFYECSLWNIVPCSYGTSHCREAYAQAGNRVTSSAHAGISSFGTLKPF